MLSNTLNTNEVKNAAGVEVEFDHLRANERERVFAQTGEKPSEPHRLSIKHQETGVGTKMVRRSLNRVDKTIISQVDSVTPVTISVYQVAVIPVGHLTSLTEVSNVVAELNSFISTTGAGTTILFNGTGNGASTLINGSL